MKGVLRSFLFACLGVLSVACDTDNKQGGREAELGASPKETPSSVSPQETPLAGPESQPESANPQQAAWASLSSENDTSSGDDEERFVYETLDGWLSLNLPESQIVTQLGSPEVAPEELWGATGTYVQEWRFPDQGIVLHMESADSGGSKQVLLITIASPCKMTTSKGLGIGSSEENVTAAYQGLINHEWSSPGKSVVVGSIYGGTIFTIENHQVTGIFIGAAAE